MGKEGKWKLDEADRLGDVTAQVERSAWGNALKELQCRELFNFLLHPFIRLIYQQ